MKDPDSAVTPTPKFTAIFLAAYAGLYLCTRLINLTLLPAHYDELAQLKRLAEFVGEGHVLVGLTDNLKWFQLWLLAGLSWLPASPLWIGRFTSILTGLLGGVGCYLLAMELFRRAAVGVLAALLYLVAPFIFFYDRMVMPDSLLAALGVWALLLSLWAVRRQQWGWAVAAGLVISAASLTKLSGLAYLVIPFGALLLFKPPARGWRLLAAMVGPALLGAAVIFLSLNDQNLAVYALKTSGAGAGLSPPVWLANTQTALDWLSSLMTLPLFALTLVGALWGLWRSTRPALYLLLVPAAVTGGFVLVSEVWYPRYLLPAAPPLLILAAQGLAELDHRLRRYRWGQVAGAVGLGVLLIPALQTDFWLLANPARAALHPEEQRQYISGWPNTYRLPEAFAFVSEQAQSQPAIYLALNTRSFIITDGLDYYVDPPDNVAVVEYDPFSGHALQDLDGWALERPTFLLLNSSREKGLDEVWDNPSLIVQAQKLASYDRPGGETSVDVYRWRSIPAMAEAWAVQSGVERPRILSALPGAADTGGLAQFRPLAPEGLAAADFVLLRPDDLANSPLQVSTTGGEGLAQLPEDWALTLYVPQQWYLFRLETNAPPQHGLAETLDQSVRLTGFDLPQPAVVAGEALHVVLHWRALQAIPADYVVFAQLLGADGRLYAQQDTRPLLPTSRWQAGQRLAHGVDVPLPGDMPAGAYQLIVGMYRPDTGQRLLAYRADQSRWPADAIALAAVFVNPPEPD